MSKEWSSSKYKLCPRGSGPNCIMCPMGSGMEQIMCPREFGANHILCLGRLRQVFNCPRGCAIVQI